jgi:hypothetical protein
MALVMLANLSLSIFFAVATATAMTAIAGYILFWHTSNHEKLEAWVDFSFTSDVLRRVIDYYRFMAVSMLFTYVLFTVSAVWLQADGFTIFTEGGVPSRASPIAISLFTLDLVLRGSFFDFMQHFDVSLAHVGMNRSMRGFVWYAFLFRMFYGLTMFKILFSFLWIILKIRLGTKAEQRVLEEEFPLPRPRK